jgi:hypothetical protein
MQNKSITSIFAGGSHSWVVLNHMNPTREIPSPVVEHQVPVVSHFQETSKSPARTSYNNFNFRASTSNPDLSTDSRPVVPRKLAEMSPFQNKTNNTKQTEQLSKNLNNNNQTNDEFL